MENSTKILTERKDKYFDIVREMLIEIEEDISVPKRELAEKAQSEQDLIVKFLKEKEGK